ncbi:hypothetical protein DCCM_3598 [Desulfocucumis palustris]|uniref:Uncharacterized protein n=1 Tax=Desulfocucumis palustris TaxID=1898651 RepID=A0A2L2XE92_9FIRM|nr:hypothetical protein DCCM_3598 [Desulfocucumis palustris]
MAKNVIAKWLILIYQPYTNIIKRDNGNPYHFPPGLPLKEHSLTNLLKNKES